MVNNLNTNQFYNYQNRNFNGDLSNHLQNTAVGHVAKKTIDGAQDKEKGFIRQAGEFVAAAGTASAVMYGMNAGVNKLSGGANSYKNSFFYKASQKIDNSWLVNNKFSQYLTAQLANLKSKLAQTHQNLKATKPFYNQLSEKLAAGSKVRSLLVPEGSQKVIVDNLVKELKQMPEDKIRQLKLTKILDDIKNDKVKPQDAYKEIGRKIKASGETLPKKAVIAFNKMELLKHAEKSSTTTISKFLIKSGIGTANFLGGTPGFAIMNGLMMGMSLKEAMEAPEGEKTKIFMEDLIGNWVFGFLPMMPLSKAVNAIGGMKNLGLTAAEASRLHELKKNKVHGIGDKKALKAEIKALNNKAVSNLSWPKRLLRKTGQFLDWGRHVKIGDIGKVNGKLGKVLYPLRWLPSGLLGGIIRLGAVMVATTPFTDLGRGISHAIFGKPKRSEENTELNNQGLQNNTNNNIMNQNTASQNFLRQTVKPQNSNSGYTYMPSAEPVKLEDSKQQSEVDKALTKSDSTLQYAQGILNQMNG